MKGTTPPPFIRLFLVALIALLRKGCAFISPQGARFLSVPAGRGPSTRMAAAASSPTKEGSVTVKEGPGLQRFYDTWTWRGHKINYRVEGDEGDPPVLLIHGFGASVGHFKKNIPALVAEGYRVHAVDLLGFGASDKPKDVQYSLELWRDMLLEFVGELSRHAEEEWIFMGNSIGGLLTLMLTEAMQEKARVKASVLFNTAGGLVSFREEEVPVYLRPVSWFFNNVVFGDFFGPMFFENFRTEDNVRSVLKQVYIADAVDDDLVNMLIEPSYDEGACDVFLKVLRGPAGPTPASLLKRINTRVLAIWGADDPWTPLSTGLHRGDSLSQHCATYELVALPETGHCPHDERPDEVHAVLFPWLQALKE